MTRLDAGLVSVKPNDFLVLSEQSQYQMEVIRANLGSEMVNEFDLIQISAPTGDVAVFSFSDINGDQTSDKLEGIIVHTAPRRQFWYSSSPSGLPPDCVSYDTRTGVGDPGGSCDVCPKNQWRSEPQRKRGKACKEVRVVFLLRPTDMLPIIIRIPPTSLGRLKAYFLSLPVHYFTVVTRLELVKKTNKDGTVYCEIQPRMVGQINESAIVEKLKNYIGIINVLFAH